MYRDKLASEEMIGKGLLAIFTAFPLQCSNAEEKACFSALLTKRVKANKFTEQRFKDAVTRLIDEHPYKSISVADVIRYDKRLTLYTYKDYLKAEPEEREDFKHYGKVGETFFYYRQSEADRIKAQVMRMRK